jgi:carboxylesterase
MAEPQVLKGAEPWYAQGSRTGVLISHGYTGSPQSMRSVAEGLAQAGFSVALPRLKGHGTTPSDMASSTATDWIAELNKGVAWLQERCDTLFMTGLSMGGTLTLFMAGQDPHLFRGIIPINAAIFLNNPDFASLAYMVGGPTEIQGVGGDIKAPGVTELAYSVVPVPTIKEFMALAKVTEELLPRITCPALIMTSRDDHLVPPANAEHILNRIGSSEKRILWLEDSYHVATLDHDKEVIVRESVTFMQAHA